jgi:hypothetical protein
MAGLRLEFVAFTPDLEILVATSMLTTSRAGLSTLSGIGGRPGRMVEVVGGQAHW